MDNLVLHVLHKYLIIYLVWYYLFNPCLVLQTYYRLFFLTVTRTEFEHVQDIFNNILKCLKHLYPNEVQNLVGLSSRIKNIESLLCVDLDDEVRIVGIWGMGGIVIIFSVQNLVGLSSRIKKHLLVLL